MSRFIVQTASTPMPHSVKSPYGKVAVLELEDGFEGRPSMISVRAKGVKSIVSLEDKLYIGKTEKSAFGRALKEAKELAERLNQNA